MDRLGEFLPDRADDEWEARGEGRDRGGEEGAARRVGGGMAPSGEPEMGDGMVSIDQHRIA